MSESVMNKIFRIDAKHSTKGTEGEAGTGLGLLLCKEFVEKNSGIIGVKSVEQEGTTFYFTLPIVTT
jgi:signal transduction histidine kinase